MNTPDSTAIVNRFFEALRILRQDRRIRGKKTFTDRYGINRWNMNSLQKEPTRDIFQPAWLAYLARDYGVSTRWLLLGDGDFYSPSDPSQSTSESPQNPPSPLQSTLQTLQNANTEAAKPPAIPPQSL